MKHSLIIKHLFASYWYRSVFIYQELMCFILVSFCVYLSSIDVLLIRIVLCSFIKHWCASYIGVVLCLFIKHWCASYIDIVLCLFIKHWCASYIGIVLCLLINHWCASFLSLWIRPCTRDLIVLTQSDKDSNSGSWSTSLYNVW
jgi:hypothetical protein